MTYSIIQGDTPESKNFYAIAEGGGILYGFDSEFDFATAQIAAHILNDKDFSSWDKLSAEMEAQGWVDPIEAQTEIDSLKTRVGNLELMARLAAVGA